MPQHLQQRRLILDESRGFYGKHMDLFIDTATQSSMVKSFFEAVADALWKWTITPFLFHAVT